MFFCLIFVLFNQFNSLLINYTHDINTIEFNYDIFDNKIDNINISFVYSQNKIINFSKTFKIFKKQVIFSGINDHQLNFETGRLELFDFTLFRIEKMNISIKNMEFKLQNSSLIFSVILIYFLN